MVTAHRHGYCTLAWLLHVSVVTARQRGYCTSAWLLHVSVVTARQRGYYTSAWLLHVSVVTGRQRGYCTSALQLHVSVLLHCKQLVNRYVHKNLLGDSKIMNESCVIAHFFVVEHLMSMSWL